MVSSPTMLAAINAAIIGEQEGGIRNEVQSL